MSDLKRTLLLAGGSGFVGGRIKWEAARQGWAVRQLVRDSSSPWHWDPDSGSIADGVLDGVDAVICLNGVSLGRRWTAAYKEKLWRSRVDSVSTLAHAVAKAHADGRMGSMGSSPEGPVFLSGSAIGFYGSRGDELLDEDSTPGTGFLAELCEAWEKAAQPAADAGLRTVQLRTGLVMGTDGMLLKMVLPLYRFNLAGPLAGGRNWMSCISGEDIARAILFAAEHLSGPVNLTAPYPVKNKEWNKELARALGRTAFLPVPGWAIKAVLGEFGTEAVLASQRVQPGKLLDAGFAFRNPTIQKIFAAEM